MRAGQVEEWVGVYMVRASEQPAAVYCEDAQLSSQSAERSSPLWIHCDIMCWLLEKWLPKVTSHSHPPLPAEIARHFRFGNQEDAHEFLRYTIDAMQKACLNGYAKYVPQLPVLG